MTKKRFIELERLCKKAWRELAKSGSDVKPDYLSKFRCDCPACSIAYMAEGNYTSIYKHCRICPIDQWREKYCKINSIQNEVPCQLSGEAYIQWWSTQDISTKKKAAAKIAKLHWTYLPEYKVVTV